MTAKNKSIEQCLADHPFLKGMTQHQIKVLSESAVQTRFEPGQIIFKTGEPANGFYLIESGTVVIEAAVNRPPIVVDIVSAGEPLGWSWLFAPYLWQFDARATEPTTAICFSGILLRQHREEDLTLSHELFKRMSKVMVRRLQAARFQNVLQIQALEDSTDNTREITSTDCRGEGCNGIE
jgi:CRP/FNR family transcriptional regulator, cyclic AMP receptor protein